MVFTMRYYAKNKLSEKILLLGMLLFWLSSEAMPATAQSGEFSIREAHAYVQSETYVLDAEVNYTLSSETINALVNGISLTIVLEVEVYRERWFLWDETIASFKRRYQLTYHLLSRQFTVTYLDTGIQQHYLKLNSALAQMGKVEMLPLVGQAEVEAGEEYQVALRTYLDIEALPAPLRPTAYFSSQWRLTSNRYLCPLKFP